jgi:SAM-dependent methyltransferase
MSPMLAEAGGGFKSEYFPMLAEVEAGNFWFRGRNRLIVWALRRLFPHMRHFLEIGCGTGFVLAGVAQAYPNANLVGSEIFSAGLPYAASRMGRAELLQMDARHIPYEGEFDVIGAFDVLEHIEEDETVLGEMKRALKPDGGVIITVPQHPWLWSRQDEHACHVRRYRMGELREKIERAGFKVELQTSFVSLLLPAMFASRVLQTKGGVEHNALSGLRLPKLINRIFETIMGVEHFFIRMGLRFPVGGSQLLIAKKLR